MVLLCHIHVEKFSFRGSGKDLHSSMRMFGDPRFESITQTDMYRMFGDAERTPVDAERYVKENERVLMGVERWEEHGLMLGGTSTKLDAIRLLDECSKEFWNEHDAMIDDALLSVFQSGDIALRLRALLLRDYASSHLQEQIQIVALGIVVEGFRSVLPNVQYDAGLCLRMLSAGERFAILGTLLRGSASSQLRCFEYLKEIPEEDRVKFIQYGLSSSSVQVQVRAAMCISDLPENDQVVLKQKVLQCLESGLKDKSDLNQLESIRFMMLIDDAERERFKPQIGTIIQDSMKTTMYPEYRQLAAEMLCWAPDDMHESMIHNGICDSDKIVRMMAGDWVDCSENDPKHIAAMREMMESEYADVRLQGIGAYFSVPGATPDALRTEYPKHFDELAVFATQTPLYSSVPSKFFHRAFQKSGSDLELLDRVPWGADRTLRGKVIRRNIPLYAYLAWKRAFDAMDVWKNLGFDYVPVEPIIRPGSVDDVKIDVFARVIPGPSVADWGMSVKLHLDAIEQCVEKIKEGLAQIGITHGHDHMANFVLHFVRTEDGDVDFSRVPRVYIIDFDQAVHTKSDIGG